MSVSIAALAAYTIAGFISTWIARRIAWQLGVVNEPNPLVIQHTQPVAYLGGVGIALGVAVSAVLIGPPSEQPGVTVSIGFALPALLYLAVGLLDDLRQLAAWPKFLLQAAVAIVAVGVGNWHPFTGVGPIDAILSLIWILTLVNAFNLTDVCDGLVGGLAVIAFCALAYLTRRVDVPLMLAGTTLGFLMLNKPPATIFLGDAGSHLLGFTIASLTLDPGEQRQAWPWPAQMLMISAVPCFELVFLTVVRTRKRLAWWRGSPDHVALRLQRAGLTRLQTDVVLWSVAGLCGVAAMGMDRMSPLAMVGLGLLIIGFTLSCAMCLLRWEDPPLIAGGPDEYGLK